MSLQWPGGFVNEGNFFRQFINLQHLVLKIPPEYLKKINFSVMEQLETLEITTDLIISHNMDNFDSEMSERVSLSQQDSDYCKGLDYANLHLPHRPLKHLILKYLMRKSFPQ